MKKGLLVLVVSLLVSSMAFAINDLDTGLKAYYQKNYKVAFDSFEKSAKMGNVQAIHYLASLYFQGLGVPKNVEKAFNLFNQSAQKGYAPSLANLSIMYYEGIGVQKILKRVLNILKRLRMQEICNLNLI
jgi:TPR repeat protein